VEDGSLLAAERVPDRRAAAVLVGGALDLVRGRGDAPGEVLRERGALPRRLAAGRLGLLARRAGGGGQRHAGRGDTEKLPPADAVVGHSRILYHSRAGEKPVLTGP